MSAGASGSAAGALVRVMDSVTRLAAADSGTVVVAASHGGIYAANLAARAGLRAVILSDAGIGKDEAGLAGLAYLDRFGLAAATVAHTSARIGDGADLMARGVLSRVNAMAARFGCAPGQSCAVAAQRLVAAPVPAAFPEPLSETRHVVRAKPGEPVVIALDSAALVGPEDEGRVAVTGSHGGLLGGQPASALKASCRAAFFNDAGVGIDEAGIGRLPALAKRGIAAATVSASSARIGDGRSSWESGVVSCVNAIAARFGVHPGLSVQDAVERLIAGQQS